MQSPFVGRHEELLQLLAALEDVRAGTGSVALVGGELGIGKTRLAGELAKEAKKQGFLVVQGRWYESGEMPAYVGMRESLWQLLSERSVRAAVDSSDPHVREIARLGAEFTTPLGLKSPEAPQATEGDQYALWQGVRILFLAAASIAPTVVTLDDLQWADSGSLGLLAFLGLELKGAPIFIAGTYREEETAPDHPLRRTLADLARTQSFRLVALSGLPKEEVATLAAGLAGSGIAPDFMDALHRQTQGNPLFVEEVMRDFLAKGGLSNRPSAGAASALPGSDLPESLRGIMSRRLSLAGADCRHLLGLAAILDREFELQIARRTSELEGDALLHALDAAIGASLIRETGPGVYALAHPLMRSVIIEGMSPRERLTTHLRAAKALESHYGPNAASYAREIAGHLLASGGLADPSETVTYCLEGARQARALFAFGDARRLLEGGIRAQDRLQDPDFRGQLLMELGYAETALGRPEEAIRVYREALAIYGSHGREEEATDVRRWLAATLEHYGRWPEALEVTREALAATKEGKSYAYVGLLGSHALALIFNGFVEEAGPCVEKLLRLGFDRQTRAEANHIAGSWHAWGAGDRNRMSRHWRQARKLFLDDGRDTTAAQVALDHAIAAYFLGQTDQSAEADREAERLAEATGRISVLADVQGFRSLVSVHKAQWMAAGEQRERWREMASEVGGTTVYGLLGQRGEALEALWRSGPEMARQSLDMAHPIGTEPHFAVLSTEAGDIDGATRSLDHIRGSVPSSGRGLFWLGTALPVASALCGAGDQSASVWLDSLTGHSGCMFDWFLVDIELGRINTMMARWDDAERHFEQAVRLCEDQGFGPFLALSRYEHALMLMTRRAKNDRRKAHLLLEQATALFDELGLGYMTDKARKALAKPRSGRPPSLGPGGLTERETTVLALLAQGDSNREIAMALFVSDRIVEHHLESIYRKLGVSNRGAAIAWALRKGNF